MFWVSDERLDQIGAGNSLDFLAVEGRLLDPRVELDVAPEVERITVGACALP